jgi:Uma2 family endonuclease
MAEPTVTLHHWTRAEYDRMVEAAVFQPEARLELVEGEIVNMTPQGSFHSTITQLLNEALRDVFGKGFTVRVQMPLAVDDHSEPEPDIAVVKGAPRDYLNAHPLTALLVVEVADTTLGFDRIRKKRVYARNGIRDYWVVDVKAERLEVYRDPLGDDYASKATYGRGDRIQPLAVPGSYLEVTDLLP